MLNLLQKEILDYLKKIGINDIKDFSIPPNSEMGDLAFACFDLAKQENTNPVELAKDIVVRFNIIRKDEDRLIKNLQAIGPYINMTLNPSQLAKLVLSDIDDDYGSNKIGHGKKVMIEYPSENTHKEFHIGHLRNVCIGNSLVGLMEKSGFKVSPINYINDFGSHVVKCLWYLEKIKDPHLETSFLLENKQKWLGMIYAEATKYIKEHEEVKAELTEYQKKFEARDPKIMKLFHLTRQWSLDGFDKIHKELGVKYERVFLESDIKAKGQKVVDELLKKKIATVGEGGAIIADLKEYGLDIALLRKSSGSGVYMTSDLALAEEKFRKIKVDESINITGTEQIFYFKQLFKILELNGFKNKMTHIGYGLVNRPDGKMSSRLGNVILYEDLRDDIYNKLFIETKNRHTDWEEKKNIEVVKTLTQAIIKFTMLKHEAEKMVTFDTEEAMSIEGYSAPYILYTVARINSIERKASLKINKKKIDFNLLNNKEEKSLLVALASYDDIIKKALTNYNPATLVKYCFDLAQEYNNYYNNYSVLKNEDKEIVKSRLVLSIAVRSVIKNALKTLTIATVEEM